MALPRYFRGITVAGEKIIHPDGSGPLAGARATVDSGGGIDRRLSLTRVVFTGGLGLFWKKKVDYRETYMLVEGDGFAFVIKVPQKQNMRARKFAAWITSEGSRLAKMGAANAPAALPQHSMPATDVRALPSPSLGGAGQARTDATDSPQSVADELAKFGALFQAGLITSAEFDEQKSRLLGTPIHLQAAPADSHATADEPYVEDADIVAVDEPAIDRIEPQARPRFASSSAVPAAEHVQTDGKPSGGIGWHPDPSGQHQLRFWNGSEWTESVRDAQVLQPPPWQPSGETVASVDGRTTAEAALLPPPLPQSTTPDPEPRAVDPGWHPDPYSRHEHRYWDGTTWTEHVSTRGRTAVDPPPH